MSGAVELANTAVALVAGACLATAALGVMLKGLLWVMLRVWGRDCSEVVREAMLTSSGFVVMERRVYPALTERVFQGVNDEHNRI